VENVFRYRIFMMYLDLAELPTLFEGYPFWSSDAPNLAFFRRKDHLGDPKVPLGESVRDLAARELGGRPAGPVRMLTHLRYFGHCFNPVSFYYCYDQWGGRVESIVAEVHNTPWGEEHCYVFGDVQSAHRSENWKQFRFSKAFHVSPFMDMDITYDWRFKEPGESLSVHFISIEGGHPLFDATLSLKRREINRASLARVLIAYPPVTMKVVAMIYWQAAKLLVRGAPFYVHPSKKPEMAKG
jgi:DUF1365 family protein